MSEEGDDVGACLGEEFPTSQLEASQPHEATAQPSTSQHVVQQMLNPSALGKSEEPLNTAHPKAYPAHCPGLLHMTKSRNFGRAQGHQQFPCGCLQRALKAKTQAAAGWCCKRGLEHRAKVTHHIMRSQAGWDPKTANPLLPASPQASEDIKEDPGTPSMWQHPSGFSSLSTAKSH